MQDARGTIFLDENAERFAGEYAHHSKGKDVYIYIYIYIYIYREREREREIDMMKAGEALLCKTPEGRSFSMKIPNDLPANMRITAKVRMYIYMEREGEREIWIR